MGYLKLFIASALWVFSLNSRSTTREPDEFIVPKLTVHKAYNAVEEKDLQALLGIPALISWTPNSKTYTYIVYFSSDRDLKRFGANTGFISKILIVKFTGSIRFSCHVLKYLLVSNEPEIGPMDAVKKGIRISNNACPKNSRRQIR